MSHREAISVPAFFTALGLEGGPRNQGAGGGQGAADGEEIESNNMEEKPGKKGREWRRGEGGRCRSVLAIRHTAAGFMARPPSWCCLLIDIKMR